jgi:hypothetical protein
MPFARSAIGLARAVFLQVDHHVVIGLVERHRETDRAVEFPSFGISTSTTVTPAAFIFVTMASPSRPWYRHPGWPAFAATTPTRSFLQVGGRFVLPPAMTRSSSATSAIDDRHRPGGIAGMRDRRDAPLRIATDGGPQRGAAVERAGNAHRAAGVGAEAGRQRCAHRSRRRCRRTNRRRSSNASQALRTPEFGAGLECGVVTRDTEGQLVHVGLADNDRAGGAQLRGDRRVGLRHETLQRGVPAVFGRPATSMLSLITTGTPPSGLQAAPPLRAASAALAAFSAPASSRVMKAFRSARALARSSAAETSASLVYLPAQMSAAGLGGGQYMPASCRRSTSVGYPVNFSTALPARRPSLCCVC